MSTQMSKEQFEQFMSAMTKLTAVMENLSLQATKDNAQSVSGQKNSNDTVVSSIRQEVIKKVAAKGFSQSFHKSIMFKKAQRALVESTDPTPIQSAYDAALQKSKAPDDVRAKIQKIKEDRDAKKPIQNRSLIGFFSSIATCDWDLVLNDTDKEIYHAMEMFLKENVENFYDDNVDLYKRVRNKDSIIKDFRTAVCKSWAFNGFNMKFTDDTKLQLDELSKEDIQVWINKLNMKTDDSDSDSKKSKSKKSKKSKKVEEKEVEEKVEDEDVTMELDVESGSDEEEVPEKQPKKTRKRRTSTVKKTSSKKSSAKKSTGKKTDDETESKKSVTKPRRRGRPVRTLAQVSDSESESSDSESD